MALQTSGQITLNDIHIEAGDTSGTQVSPNNANVRALIGKAAATQMALSEWYGASAAWETVITCGNPGGGSPGVFTGYCAAGALANPGGGSSLAALGTATNVVDPIPASDGVASWTFNLFGRAQGFGTQTFYLGFRDTANPAQHGNTPNILTTTVPFTKITMAHNAAYTLNPATIPASVFIRGDSTTSNSGCQWVFYFITDNNSTNPTYNEITDVLFTTGNVYIKFE